MKFGLALLSVPEPRILEILDRWEKAGSPPIWEFAPYFRHVYGVDLFFNLAMAADLISRVRPAGKADNKVDIAYLYYLPFCMVFVSNDKLHKRVVPLFLRDDQSFIVGDDLKADLRTWARAFEEITWPPDTEHQPDPKQWRGFVARGRDLARRLHEELGSSIEVVYGHDQV